jgi:hypothetical protein
METTAAVFIGKFLVLAGMGGVTGSSFGEGKPVRGFSEAITTVGLYLVLFF